MSSCQGRSHHGAEGRGGGGAQAIPLQLYDSSEGPAEQHAVPALGMPQGHVSVSLGVEDLLTWERRVVCACTRVFEPKRFSCVSALLWKLAPIL